jgi:HK97 family phage major capsid protein
MHRRRHLIPPLGRPSNCLAVLAILSTKAIRERIGELSDRAQAICDLATEANRELTAEEKAEVDGILGRGKAGETGYQAGQIGTLEADLERAERLEARQAQLAAARISGGAAPQRSDGPGTGGAAGDLETPRAASIRIPARARFSHGSLKAFRDGPHAIEEAYLTGQFLMATILRHEPAQQWCRDHGIEIRMQQATGNDALGGFLVPAEMERRIIMLRELHGVARRECFVQPMSGDTLTVPRAVTGVTAAYVGENTAIANSEMAWDQVSLTARKLAAMVRFSTEIDEDAIVSMADTITDQIAWAFALAEDTALFMGTGLAATGGINGLLGAIQAGSRVTPVAGAGTTSFGALLLANFESMIGLLPVYAESNAKWYISKVGFAASMQRLMDAAGGNTIDTLAGGVGRQFLGYPVVISQVLNSVLAAQASTNGLCYLGDLRMGTLLGSRRGITITSTADRYFELDQLAVKGTERYDINVHGRGTAALPGPIIQLSTPAN